jgi:hypothetical protein
MIEFGNEISAIDMAPASLPHAVYGSRFSEAFKDHGKKQVNQSDAPYGVLTLGIHSSLAGADRSISIEAD